MEISLLAEDAPMSSPPTGPTASDLLRVVEEIQERKRQLDLTLLGTMPNVIAGHALRICQSHAECEGRSARLVMVPADIAAKMVNELHYLMPETVKHARAEDIKLMPKEFGLQIATAMNEFMTRFAMGDVSPNIKKVPRGHGDINIQNLTITQDFKEADPDRVFHRVTNEIASLANSPGKGRLSTGMAGGL